MIKALYLTASLWGIQRIEEQCGVGGREKEMQQAKFRKREILYKYR